VGKGKDRGYEPNTLESASAAAKPNDVERALWQRLRFWQLDGYKFRRQQPLGNYIVDFVCLQKRLIIELDGGQHAQEVNHDAEREAWLHAQGFVILRFWNNDVLKNSDGVMEMIVKGLQSTPCLNPFPQWGRTKMQSKKFRLHIR
jgi:very-short-patch-repair endonuclease